MGRHLKWGGSNGQKSVWVGMGRHLSGVGPMGRNLCGGVGRNGQTSKWGGTNGQKSVWGCGWEWAESDLEWKCWVRENGHSFD